MSNLFRDNLYNEFPDPNKKIEEIGEKVEANASKVDIFQTGVTNQLAEIVTQVESFSGSDNQKLQAALATGKNIQLGKNKTYTVTTPLSVTNSNQRIRGNGATIINSANIDKVFNIAGTSGSYVKNVVIEDLTISSGTITPNTVNGQIHCNYVDRVTIKNCIITASSATTSAITLTNVTNSVIKDNILTGFTKGIFANASYNSVVENNQITCNRTPGNFADNYYGVQFDDNTTQTRTVKDITVQNNFISGYSLSISLRYSTKCFVQGNLIANTSFGMTIDRSNFTSIAGNTIEVASTSSSPQLAIELVCSNDNVVNGNVISCSSGHLSTGIGIYGDTAVVNYNAPTNNLVAHNSLTGLNQGILIKQNSQQTKVVGNSIKDCNNGIQLLIQNIDGTDVSENTIKNCLNYGIIYDDTYNAYTPGVHYIKNNTVKDCPNSIFGSAGNLGLSAAYIQNNVVTNTGIDSRAIYGVFSNCYLIGNTVKHKGAGYLGISVTYNASNTGKSVYLLRNNLISCTLQFTQGDTFYTYKNLLAGGANYLKVNTPVVNEMVEISYT